jgi:two-component system, NtrC family, nitrogen regulation sensor histidine kinase NtrY
MDFRRSFALAFAWRMVALAAAAALLAAALSTPGLAATRLLAGLLVVAALWSVWHHLGRTNRELARFVEALRHGDFAQKFGRTRGGGFSELGDALQNAIGQLRSERAAASDEARINAAIADEAPSALLLIDEQDRVTLANKAARKLFHRLAGTLIGDFAAYGSDFAALLRSGAAGDRRVVPLRIDGVLQRAMVSRASLALGGRPLAIVAVQPIQQELSSVELAAQADLVRVLTHEIMNSMTPVVSLAGSAAQLIARVERRDDPDLDDARLAIETLARRASGIMHFVQAYRTFSRVPAVQRQRIAAREWSQEIARLFGATDAGSRTSLDVSVDPPETQIDGDPDLLAQVVLNLLKNGAEAASGHAAAPRVALKIGPLPAGRTRIAVQDNGAGIDPAMAEEIFLPFYTTKPGGTGVGLSLARRIMAAHGGHITLGSSADGGACFELAV